MNIPVDKVRTHQIAGVGTIVTVTISKPDALWDTTFSLVLPTIDLEPGTSVDLTVPAINALTADPIRVNRPRRPTRSPS